MSDLGIFIFGMFVFGVAICSSLITVLAGNVTPSEETSSPKKQTDAGSSAAVVAGSS